MTRILVADDHEVVRTGLRSLVEGRFGWEIVAEAVDGREAIVKARETEPDVAILDYSMPHVNGIETARQIRKRNPNVEVLLFTAHGSEILAREALEAGVRAYLLKSEGPQRIISAIEALAARQPFFSEQFTQKLLGSSFQIQDGRPRHVLTSRERAVVQLIAEGCTNREASVVLEVSIKTVESHRATILRKLKVKSTSGLVRYAVRNRWIEA